MWVNRVRRSFSLPLPTPHRMRVCTVRFPVNFKRYFHTSQGWLQAKRRLNWLCRSASLPCRARLAPPCLHRFGPSPCPGHYSRHWATMAIDTWFRISSSGKSPSRRCRDLWIPEGILCNRVNLRLGFVTWC